MNPLHGYKHFHLPRLADRKEDHHDLTEQMGDNKMGDGAMTPEEYVEYQKNKKKPSKLGP